MKDGSTAWRGCGAPMRSAAAPDTILWLCGSCGGVWLDNAASHRVASALLSRTALAHAQAAAAAEPHRAAAGFRSPSHPHGERRCPTCPRATPTGKSS